MRKLGRALVGAAFAAVLVLPAVPVSAASVGSDVRVTQHTYVRHDGGSDAAIEGCNDVDPTATVGNFRQKNEPFSVVDPQNPDIVVSGWNDYCSDWMGLGFSTDGGQTWTNSLVPGYPQDTSVEGMRSPEFGRTNTASDPVGAFDNDGHFYFGFLAYNGFAGPGTNSDVAVARYDVVDPATHDGDPLDYVDTTRVYRGPAAANFNGIFSDKNMIEVDRTGGDYDGNVYFCWTKFPAFGQTTIMFSRSTNGGLSFSKPIGISGKLSGQGCDIAVESDGDVYVDWRDFDGRASFQKFGVSVARSGNGGVTFDKIVKVAPLIAYNPFDTTRDCGDGADLCPSGFVFHRVPLEPRITSDPTGELPGVFAVYNAVDPSTVVNSDTTYSSAGRDSSGQVGQSKVYVARSLDDGKTWTEYAVANHATGHQYFPDGDALAGQLAVVWQDSIVDGADYSVQRPVGNLADATSSGTDALSTFVAVSTDGTSFGSPVEVASVRQQPQYEMFDAASVPFLGDYNWIQLATTEGGSLFGYMTWTDNRDVVPGNDPREDTQDGFDVKGCWVQDADGTWTRTCLNGGGYNQNIYGNSITLP